MVATVVTAGKVETSANGGNGGKGGNCGKGGGRISILLYHIAFTHFAPWALCFYV